MRFCIRSNKVCFDWESLFRSYRHYVTESDTVLEIGASNVERTKDLSRYCGRLIGLELFPERTPEDFENVTYVTGDWQQLTKVIGKKTIDVAVSSHVIEHVPDDSKAIEELYGVLRPRGVALINTPNRKRLTRAIIEIFTGERQFPWWEHQKEYTEEDLFKILDRSPFIDYAIIPRVLGLHGGPVFIYLESVPDLFRRFANFWEVHLFK